jgi:hypothetical protein
MIKITTLLIFFISINVAYSADKWDKEDLILASIFTATTVIDWGQTRDMVKINEKTGLTRGYIDGQWISRLPHRETNYLLGNYPTIGKVDTYMPLAIASTLTIAHYLPKKKRKFFLYFVSILEIYTIHNNQKFGLKINF